MDKKITALIIMDGYGYSKETKGNAIACSTGTNVSKLQKIYPHTLIGASGLSVGLPDGQMGNSEVGHLNLGSGRIIYQDLTRITKSINDGDFFTNSDFLKAIDNAVKHNKSLHLMGLLSNGGVHSHNTHLYALLKLAKVNGVKNVFVHCFTDGRDVSPTSGVGFIKELQQEMEKIGIGKIATIMGRYYAMDRDNRWDRVEKAYAAMCYGEGELIENPALAMEESYVNNVTDEFITPKVVVNKGNPIGTIENGDSVIFFNFRPDRARELTNALTQKDFNYFEKKNGNLDLTYVCMTQYNESFKDILIAFKHYTPKNTLAEYLGLLDKKYFKIAETEKYAHVTFFFNGGVETPFKNEERILVPSPKVATYDLQPEMSAYQVMEKALSRIEQQTDDLMVLNFANCDMVGHTGVFDAAVKAVNVVDECVGKLIEKILALGGSAVITADHGNADKMIDENGQPFTAHTTNPVPVIIVSEKFKNFKLRDGGILADISPTLLDMMGLAKPIEMTGESLIIK